MLPRAVVRMSAGRKSVPGTKPGTSVSADGSTREVALNTKLPQRWRSMMRAKAVTVHNVRMAHEPKGPLLRVAPEPPPQNPRWQKNRPML
eukprot:284392-Karenia_brevis.AAC.1